MARVLMVNEAFESDSRKLLRVPHMLCNASSATAAVAVTPAAATATATSSSPCEESREKEECRGKKNEHFRRWMEAHTDYIYTQDLEP